MDTNSTNTNNGQFTRPYDHAACVECGDCLANCPVISLPRAIAIREIRKIRSGATSRIVSTACQSCFTCSVRCPVSANPASLFISSFNDVIATKGLPAHASYFQPHAEINFRSYVYDRMPAAERAIVESWKNDTPCEEIAYPGCNMCLTPYLTEAWFMRGLDIRGGFDLCCGEVYYRTGMFVRLRDCASRLNDFTGRLGVRKMMILCNAGYNIMTNVLPQYGFRTDIEITSYLPWLWDRLQAGDIQTRPIHLSVTIQDSCHSKLIGDEYAELPRKILTHLGVRIVEMPHNRDCNLCCGIGGGFAPESGYHPAAIAASTLRVTTEAATRQADAIVTYCSGCLQSLSAGMAVFPSLKPVYHIIQVIQRATGEKPRLNLNRSRGAMMLKGIARHQIPMMFQP